LDLGATALAVSVLAKMGLVQLAAGRLIPGGDILAKVVGPGSWVPAFAG
jgi:hypothetical protein